MRWLIAALFLTTPAFAQPQPQPQPQTPREQAITQKLLMEISNGIQCSEDAIALRAQVADLQKQLDEFKKAK